MLVISRRPGERLVVGHPAGAVEVVLLDIDPRTRTARVGVVAPPGVAAETGEARAAAERAGYVGAVAAARRRAEGGAA